MSEYDVQPEPPTPPPTPPPTLNYRPPIAEPRPRSGGSTFGLFTLGFFAALGACAGGFFLFGYTYDKPTSTKIVLAVVVFGVIGTLIAIRWPLQRRYGFVGYGRGLTVGLILGMMALGPCALCYLAS